MDKDMERLGKERLKRVRRRRQLATFIISMAVIVLGITAYRLIQPASAADQNQKDFTIDNVTENYVNLQKLQSNGSYTKMSSEGKPVDWNGEKFKLEVQLDFGIGKNDTVDANGNTVKNYYYVYDQSVTIPDELCNYWKTKCDDNGDKEQFQYRYIKNEDGTYAILIKFVDGYIEGNSSDIKGWAKAEALGEGKTNDSGDVDIYIGGDVTITVDKDNIHWNGNDSLNYDISVKKSNTNNNNIGIDENGNYYVEFTVDVSSGKGTPDDIEITDEFNGNGMRVDTTGFTYSIKKNGQAVDSSYTATATGKNDPADAGKATLTAKLPKLSAGESCSITYRYYLTNAGDLGNNAAWQATNFVTGKSTDQKSKETVIDTSSSYVKYYKNLIEKSGKYDKTNNRIIWTVTVNKSCEDIAGAVLTDDMFDKITGIDISPSDGYTINKDSSGKVTSVTFNPTDGNMNCNKYTVKYYTDALRTFDDQKFNNKATLTKDDKSYDGSSSVNVPKTKQDITKKLVEAQKTDNGLYTLKWQAKFTIPASGFPKEFGIADTMSSKSQKNCHYMTYTQMNDFVSQVKKEFDGYIGDITVKYLDENNNSQKADFSKLSETADYRFTSVNISFNKDYPISNSERTVAFTYSTTADTTVSGRTEYVNKFEALNSSASASYSHVTSEIKKTDGNGREGQTYLKTTESDGTLTWRVDVLMDADATEYAITDKLPKGVTLQSVRIMLAYPSNDGYTYSYFDGTWDTVSVGDWFTDGIKTSTMLDESTNTVVTRVVNPDKNNTTIHGWFENSHIYVVYKCTIDDFENFEAGKSVDYKNIATASSNTNSDMGWVKQTQTMSKPGESGSDNPTEGDKVVSKNFKWDEDNHRLRYTVIINPDGKDYLPDSDTLKLTDVLQFQTMTFSPQALWYIDLMPATVQFRQAIKQDDGTYKAGDTVDGCKWAYTTKDGTYEWNDTSYRTISADIPDGKAIMLTYTYQVNAKVLGTPDQYNPIKMDVSNTARLEGVEKGEDRKDNQTVYKESKSSAGVIKSNTFTLYKVDKTNYGKQLEGAEFELFGYTSDGSYKSLGKYTTDKNGRIDISMSTDNLEYNTQYYVVETKAPDGYILSTEPHKEYFYFSADTSAHPVVAENSSLQGSDMAKVNTPYYYEDTAVSTTSISVDKKWTDSKNNPLSKTDGKIYLQLHQVDSAGNDKKYGNPVEVTADSAGEWSYVFENLPLQSVDENGILTGTTYRYYVTEVGINQNNSMSGYDVSYIFKDINGTQITKTDANVAPGSANAIESGTVEITNKLIEYQLPETGGSGNRWLYMLSGVVLIAIASITLFYKNIKHYKKGECNMKTIKRGITLVLAMILTFAMSVTVFADGESAKKTFTITVNNAKAGHTYEAYQILKGDLSESETTLSNVGWGSGIQEDKQTDLESNKDAKAYVEKLSGMKSNSSELKAEAQKIASALSTTVAGSVSVTQDNAKTEITGLEPGYYLIKDKDSSLTGDEAYTEYILNIVADTTITPKTDVPSVEKKVKDINDTTGDTTGWQDSADYDITDVVPFQLTATLPANVESYKSYYLKFDDTLSEGLDFNEGTVTVKLGDKDVTSFFTTNYDAAGKKLTFTCDNILAEGFEAKNGDKVVVEYNATLNENAVIGSKGNPNKVKLEFSNNPNNGGEGDKGETPEDTVIVFTYKVVINKVDENNKALDGAEFTLYKKIKGEADKEIKAVISGDKNDVFTFSGLDDGDYVLKETKTPDEYNTANDIAFTIKADHSIESDAPELNSLSGDKVTGNITLKADKAEGSLSTPVQNLKGSVLPSTGGAGRVAIYVIGAILVVGGGIVLVTKKRVK